MAQKVLNKLTAIITAELILVAAVAFLMGRTAGVRHALADATIYTVECYTPDDPERNARPDGTDQTIYIELDGTTYEHGMYQG